MTERLTITDLQDMIGRSRFHQMFKPEVLNIDYDHLSLKIKFHMCDEFERQPGTNQWHGGVISAVVDTVGCYGLAMLSAEPLPTINFRTDYLRPAISTDLMATAMVRKAGRTIGVVDVDIVNDAERLIAVGRASYAIQAPLPISG